MAILIGIIVSIWGGLYWRNKHEVAKETYYNELNGYAFELIECNQGANHYGEREYYKIFPNRRGLYLFVAWHDPFDCDDPDCDLESKMDTVWFNYKKTPNHAIMFETGLLSGDRKWKSVIYDPYNEELDVLMDDTYYEPLQIVEKSVNRDLVEQIFE